MINVFYCGFDGERMTVRAGRYSLYYACTKYEDKYLKDGEKPCRNRISPEAACAIEEMEIEPNKLYQYKNYEFVAEDSVGDIRKIYVKNRRISK